MTSGKSLCVIFREQVKQNTNFEKMTSGKMCFHLLGWILLSQSSII